VRVPTEIAKLTVTPHKVPAQLHLILNRHDLGWCRRGWGRAPLAPFNMSVVLRTYTGNVTGSGPWHTHDRELYFLGAVDVPTGAAELAGASPEVYTNLLNRRMLRVLHVPIVSLSPWWWPFFHSQTIVLL